CGYQHPFYNSCQNRYCPKCGALAKERWLAARKNELLAVAYFETAHLQSAQPRCHGNQQKHQPGKMLPT
ncbi:MAG: transposase zinc-binding domain-containing protein, partial [bacterium]